MILFMERDMGREAMEDIIRSVVWKNGMMKLLLTCGVVVGIEFVNDR